MDWHSERGPTPHEPPGDRVRPDLRRRPGARRGRHALVQVLEEDILPRLMSAHRVDPLSPADLAVSAAHARVVEAVHIQALVEASLHAESSRALELVQRLRGEGLSIESIYLDLLTPAARRLGELWVSDDCDFVMVTLGLLRIQQAMYDLSPDFLREGSAPTARRILLAPIPGSHHTFGVAMLADFFRHDGWDVTSSHEYSRAELLRMVRAEWFDIIGVSVSTPAHIQPLSVLIPELRKASLNKGILVMVGGPLAPSTPDLAPRTGADVMALDAQEAVDMAGRVIPARASMVG